ncbi:MAG: hypothetical protein ACREXR_07515 [Gammaproteobacteria bacterium]
MRRAIALAKQVPAFPFGAVIVRRATGVIVAEGHNRCGDNRRYPRATQRGAPGDCRKTGGLQ